jgi:hypothetical protein
MPYPGYSTVKAVCMKYFGGGEDAIFMLRRQIEGGTNNKFSRQNPSLHNLSATATYRITLKLKASKAYVLIPNSIFDAMASFYKITVPCLGFMMVGELYMK